MIMTGLGQGVAFQLICSEFIPGPKQNDLFMFHDLVMGTPWNLGDLSKLISFESGVEELVSGSGGGGRLNVPPCFPVPVFCESVGFQLPAWINFATKSPRRTEEKNFVNWFHFLNWFKFASFIRNTIMAGSLVGRFIAGNYQSEMTAKKYLIWKVSLREKWEGNVILFILQPKKEKK